jgi:hypothetical protein
MSVIPGTNGALITGDALDGGSCCDSAVNFNLLVGTKAIPVRAGAATPNHAATIDTTAGNIMVPASCAALKSTSYTTGAGANAYGISEIDDS